MDLDQPIKNVILQAIRECHTDVPVLEQLEEHGGWILKKGNDYKFFFLKNDNTGTVRAQMLFSANKKSVGDGPLKAIVKEGWSNFATFHTHPQFSINPSSIDWNLLFQNSKYNFIYSPATDQLSCSARNGGDDENQTWVMTVWDVVNNDFVKTNAVVDIRLSDEIPYRIHEEATQAT